MRKVYRYIILSLIFMKAKTDKKSKKTIEKKGIPLWFLWTVIGILIYAAVSNTIIFLSKNVFLVRSLFYIVVGITIIWFMLNSFLAIYFRLNNYETKAWAFCTYYAVLNGLNLIKIFNHIDINLTFLFYFQILTKVFELLIVIPALVKYYRTST
jgi:hypothetical protein